MVSKVESSVDTTPPVSVLKSELLAAERIEISCTCSEPAITVSLK